MDDFEQLLRHIEKGTGAVKKEEHVYGIYLTNNFGGKDEIANVELIGEMWFYNNTITHEVTELQCKTDEEAVEIGCHKVAYFMFNLITD